MLRATVLAGLIFLLSAAGPAAGGELYDGELWVTLSDFEKDVFTAGMLTGLSLGEDFCARNFIEGPPTPSGECAAHFHRTYNNLQKKYLTGVTQAELKAALDQYYADPDRRSALIKDAVVKVMKTLRGETGGGDEKNL
ncbi:MAG: hypothetical protein AB1896_09900 [Thermodesulfobacteriota bacterium]